MSFATKLAAADPAHKNQMKINAKRFDTNQAVQLTLDGPTVAAITPIDDQAELPWIAPGLIDLQVNGYGGQEFSSPELTIEKVSKIAWKMDSFGVVRTCPTITTNSTQTIDHAMRTIAQACAVDSGVDHRFPGIHLEGPFISTKEGARGAHPIEHVCPPDYEKFARWQEIADGRIRIVTLSPEYDEAIEFIQRVSQAGGDRLDRTHCRNAGPDQGRHRRGARRWAHTWVMVPVHRSTVITIFSGRSWPTIDSRLGSSPTVTTCRAR